MDVTVVTVIKDIMVITDKTVIVVVTVRQYGLPNYLCHHEHQRITNSVI